MNHLGTKLKIKFAVMSIFTLLWLCLSMWISYYWYLGLTDYMPKFLAILIVGSLACLPAFNSASLFGGVLLDKQRNYKNIPDWLPDVTIMIAAYNEEKGIYHTLEHLSRQKYPGNMLIKVIDNNSKDNTKSEIMRAMEDFPMLHIEYLFEGTPGKFAALNNGLATTTSPYVITLDADTTVYGNIGVATLVNHIYQQEKKGRKIGGVAGGVFVHNPKDSFMTRLQEWEYFLAINNIKRAQGIWSSTLVCQGAFSVYNTELLKEIGGWKDSIGEDIVLTWDIMEKDYMPQFEPEAIVFTDVPTTYKAFFKQRSRWSRGLIEALRQRPFWKYPKLMHKLFVLQDYILPIVDFGLACFFIPGILLAIFFHNYLIVGPLVLLMLPWTLLVISAFFYKEYKYVFKQQEKPLKVYPNILGFIFYTLFFNLMVAPAACWGYLQETFQARRQWK